MYFDSFRCKKKCVLPKVLGSWSRLLYVAGPGKAQS